MGKKTQRRRQEARENAYGRIPLSELTEDRMKQWRVRAGVENPAQFQRKADASEPPPTTPAIVDATVNASAALTIGLRCGTCDIASFGSLEEQHAHFKSEWHCLNLKRKAKGSSILSMEEAEAHLAAKQNKKKGEKTEDASSSSSSSESSSTDEELAQEEERTLKDEPVVEFMDDKTSVFKIYKAVMPHADQETFHPFDSLRELTQSRFRWAVFLLRSGRFAGAVFEKDKAIVHKSFQRYTTRRKQGGSQSAHDAAGGKAKSAGATLRRYNEQALKQDIADLLVQWKPLLHDTELIFIGASRVDRSTFFGGKTPVLQPKDKRLRKIPFMTLRPTFEEVCRVRSELASVRFTVVPIDQLAWHWFTPIKTSTKATPAAEPQKKALEQETAEQAGEEEEQVPELIELVQHGDVRRVKALVEATDDCDTNVLDRQLMTPLHHAAALTMDATAVQLIELLLSHGANPSLLDVRGRPPYFLCQSKDTRNAFRRFMAEHPEACDYSKSQIPSALTNEMEVKRKEKEAEKRRRARERKKQQKKADAEAKEREQQRQEEEQAKILAGLKCDSCGQYAGKTPFQRLEFKYCSTACVNDHRRRLMSEAALKRLGGA